MNVTDFLKWTQRIEKRHEKYLADDPYDIFPVVERSFFCIVEHDDPAYDHNEHTGKDDQAGIQKILKFR